MNNHEISYSISGKETKGTIVALHGVTDNGASLSDIASHWNDEWTVCLFDTLGHGLSRPFTTAELADPFQAAVNAMAPHIIEAARQTTRQKIVLMGHSLGGAIAAEFARRFPDLLECLILEDPALLTPEQASFYRDGVEELVAKQELVEAHVGEAVVELMRHYTTWPPAEYGPWAQGKVQVDRNFVATGVVGACAREVLAELKIPTLLLTGDGDDVLFGPQALTELAEVNPHFLTTTVISHASHTVRRDQPDTFYRLVDEFMSEALPTQDLAVPAFIAPELAPIVTTTPPQNTADVTALRARGKRLLSGVSPAPGIDAADVMIPTEDGVSIAVRRLRRQGDEPITAGLLSIHGGGYIGGDPHFDDARNSDLVTLWGNALVYSPDYRLAPEHPAPAAILDCLHTLRALAAQVPGLPLYIYADSAGAGLAQQVLAHLIRSGEKIDITKVFLLEPCLEPAMLTTSFARHAHGPIWTREASTHAWKHYLTDDAQAHYYVPSPTVAASMPATLVIVNPADPLRDEGIRLATELTDAGVPVELHMFAGTIHGALSVPGTQTWERVRHIITEFTHAHTDTPRHTPTTNR